MKRLFLGLFALIVLSSILVFAAGVRRYGGRAGLRRRISVALAARRPLEHDPWVPTPLPTSTPPLVGDASTPVSLPTATAIPTFTPPPPSPSPAVTPLPFSPTSTSTPALTTPPAIVALEGFSHFWQTWNNCGPATLAMQLSYFGSTLGQKDIRRALRPNEEDKNVRPDELAAFAREQGYNAMVRVNGDNDLLKQFIANGIPVLIETWLEPKPGDGMGHYRLLTGYDERARKWIAFDSYVSTGVKRNEPYRGIRIPYKKVDRWWPVFNYAYLVVYTDEQAPLVQAILGADVDDQSMWERALAGAQRTVDAEPKNAFAWFNLGSDLVALGRYEEAASAYDRARVIGLPWRMLWYQFGPFQAYYEIGRYQEVLALADATLSATPYVEELHYWRGLALLALGQPDLAQQALNEALTLNPNFDPARQALARLAQP